MKILFGSFLFSKERTIWDRKKVVGGVDCWCWNLINLINLYCISTFVRKVCSTDLKPEVFVCSAVSRPLFCGEFHNTRIYVMFLIICLTWNIARPNLTKILCNVLPGFFHYNVCSSSGTSKLEGDTRINQLLLAIQDANQDASYFYSQSTFVVCSNCIDSHIITRQSE